VKKIRLKIFEVTINQFIKKMDAIFNVLSADCKCDESLHVVRQTSSSLVARCRVDFKDFNMDIIRLIISYDGTMKERNGIYMNQIPKTDCRYELLRNIPKKKDIGNRMALVYLKKGRIVLFSICVQCLISCVIVTIINQTTEFHVTKIKLQ
jgi:hypothetical protein